jgi:hypothetical protein
MLNRAHLGHTPLVLTIETQVVPAFQFQVAPNYLHAKRYLDELSGD